NQVEEIAAPVGNDCHVGRRRGSKRLDEKEVGTLVGRDLPGVRISNGDIFNVLVRIKLDCNLDVDLALDPNHLVRIVQTVDEAGVGFPRLGGDRNGKRQDAGDDCLRRRERIAIHLNFSSLREDALRNRLPIPFALELKDPGESERPGALAATTRVSRSMPAGALSFAASGAAGARRIRREVEGATPRAWSTAAAAAGGA